MVITYSITQFVPGAPVEQLLAQLSGQDQMTEVGSTASELYRGAEGIDQERLAEIKTLYGFDKPAIERFIIMMGNYLYFDFGESYHHHQSSLI
jgi:microcin C transport system permease protein